VTKISRKNKGFSLIELLMTLGVISLVFIMLLTGLFFTATANKKAQINQKMFRDERYLNLYIQKQILESDKIIYKGGIVYLRDPEKSEDVPPKWYYNYYTNSNGLVNRKKVKGDTLKDIGAGGSSQFAEGIQDFSLSLAPNNAIVLRYTLSFSGETIQRETIIQHGKTVELR